MDSNHHPDPDSDDSDSDENEAIDNTPIYLGFLGLLSRCRRRLMATLQPSNRRWTGQDVVNNLLNCRSSSRIQSQLQIKLDTFYQLHNWLLLNTQLRSSIYRSRVVSIEEKLVIFIFIASTNTSNRTAQERFNRSGSTISK
jgi:hypothetical protein